MLCVPSDATETRWITLLVSHVADAALSCAVLVLVDVEVGVRAVANEVNVAVLLGTFVVVGVDVLVAEGSEVSVAVAVEVLVGVAVGLLNGVCDGTLVAVAEFVAIGVSDSVDVDIGVTGVLDGFAIGI